MSGKALAAGKLRNESAASASPLTFKHSSKSESYRKANQGNEAMFSKFRRSFLLLIVATISLFNAMVAVETYAVQEQSIEVRANAFIPLAKSFQAPDSPEENEKSESKEGFSFTDPYEQELSQNEAQLRTMELGIERRLSELREEHRKISRGLLATTPYKSKMLQTKIELLEAQLTAMPPRLSLYQNEIQLMLHDKIEQRIRLRERYEDNHPSIKRLDAQIELLKTKLNAETESSALDHEKSKLARLKSQRELQQKLKLAEKTASRSASLLRSDDFKDEQSKNDERVKLQKAVQKLFDLRMQLQTAQLDDAEAKLAASRQRLVRRQSLAKQIVQRRVNELVETDETKWGAQLSGPAIPSTQAARSRSLPLFDPMYKVGPGDVLAIFVPRVFNEIELKFSEANSGYPIHVKSDGRISLPMIGPLKVAGKTALEIEDEVKKKYADGPDPIFEEEYVDSISVVVYQAYKPAVRKSVSVSRLDDQDAAQLAAQTFLNLYFSGDIEKATELTNNPRPLKTLREFVDPETNAAPKVNGFSGGRIEANIFTGGIVQLKKALPRTGRTQAMLSVRMEKNDSDGWRVLQVFLGGVTTARQKAPLSSTPNQSEYKGLLGKWEVVSIKGKGGKFMTLDDSTKIGDTLLIPHYDYRSREGDQRKLVVKRKWLSDEIKASWTKNDSLWGQPSDRPKQLTYRSENGEKYHLGDPEDPPEFAIYRLGEDELTLVAGDPEDLKVDKFKVRILADDNSGDYREETRERLRPNYAKDFLLPPGKRQLWVKLRRVDPSSAKTSEASSKPVELKPAGDTPARSKSLRISDASPKLIRPRRTRFGLAYYHEKFKYRKAIAVSAAGDTGRVMILVGAFSRPDETSRATLSSIDAKEVTITVTDGSDSPKTFALPAANTDENGNASQFELKNPSLVAAMKRGSYKVNFKNENERGKKYEFDVYQHADTPLVPRLQLIEAFEFGTDDQSNPIADSDNLWVLPWKFPDDQQTEIRIKPFEKAIIDENDILSAVAGRNAVSDGSDSEVVSYKIDVRLTAEGEKRMSKATRELLQKIEGENKPRIAIVVDGKVVMAPQLNGPLSRAFTITGDFTKAEAIQLASFIKKHKGKIE